MYDVATGSAPQDDLDLAKFDADFADAPVEERGEFEPVPDGSYQVRVESVELTRSKTSNNPMLKWRLQIVAPRSQGRVLWKNNLIVTRENIKWLKSDLAVCGLTLQKLSDLPENLDKLLDLTLEVTKKTQGDFENLYFNRRIVTAQAGQDALPADDDIPF